MWMLRADPAQAQGRSRAQGPPGVVGGGARARQEDQRDESGRTGARPRADARRMLAEAERQRLFRIIENLVQWENTQTKKCCSLRAIRSGRVGARLRRECGSPRAKELFDRNRLPAFHDPFAGAAACRFRLNGSGSELCERPKSGGGAHK